MIELRWANRWIEGKVNGEPIAFKERVLQYRTWQVRIDASGAITPLPLPIEWSDWTDVPTVEE